MQQFFHCCFMWFQKYSPEVNKQMNIAIAGTGYVGMSLAVLLSQHNHVTAVDILPERISLINENKSPVKDEYIEKYLAEKELDLSGTTDGESAYGKAECVIIAVPTNYSGENNTFDTSAVDSVISLVTKANPDAFIVIKSTVPVGYTQSACQKYGSDNILFCPEFLRESKALYDNLYPSRIIVGCSGSDKSVQTARQFAGLLLEGAVKKDVSTHFMGFGEAEAIKLFANTFLALRVSFFNELDTYAETRGLDTKFKACVLIPGSAIIITIPLSDTAVTVYQRTPNSFWQILRMCLSV